MSQADAKPTINTTLSVDGELPEAHGVSQPPQQTQQGLLSDQNDSITRQSVLSEQIVSPIPPAAPLQSASQTVEQTGKGDSASILPAQQTEKSEPFQSAPAEAVEVDPDDSPEAEEAAWSEPLPAKPVVAKAKRRSRALEDKGKAGPPSRFRRRMLPIIIRLKAGGVTEAEIAQRLGISPSRFASWKRERPEIAEAVAVGQEYLLDRVERGLTARALGWVGPAEKVLRDGRVVRHKQFHPPDTQAAMSVLTNLRSTKWKRNLEGNQGLALQVVINSPRIAAALQRHKGQDGQAALPSVPAEGQEQE